MAVRFYDEAVVNKISNWIKDPNLKVLKPDESTRLFEMKFDETKDKPLTLPLISISRDKSIEILNIQKQPKTFDGFTLASNEKISVPINVIPIQIGYQIDIYTKGMIEADEYIRNFVFNLINYPKLMIELPYNDFKIKHESNIILESSINDNTDIKEHLFADQFVRFTIKFIIDDAYLFSLPNNPSTIIESSSLNVIDRVTNDIVESTEIINK